MNPLDPLNDPSKPHPDDAGLPDTLRWQLRALQQPQAPARDLWPDIAARVAKTPQQHESRQRWGIPASLAAAVLVAVGVFLLVRPSAVETPAPTATVAPSMPSSSASPVPTLVQIEAAGLTRQYQAAVAEIAMVPPSPALQPAVEELDRSAALILDALQHDPDSRLLLQQLRRTYTRRLALAHRMS